MTNKDLKAWLAPKPKGREWLATECHVHKSTVDGWCSTRRIPGPAQQIIQTLMIAEALPQSHITVPFTSDEFSLIEHATQLGRYDDTTDFARDAIKARARQITEGMHRLNEPPGIYTAGKQKRES